MSEPMIPPNSDISRSQRGQEPTIKKRGFLNDIIDRALGPRTNNGSFVQHVLYDIIAPKTRDVIGDALHDGVDRILRKDKYTSSNTYNNYSQYSSNGVQYTSYNQYYNPAPTPQPMVYSQTPSPNIITFPSRAMAEGVLEGCRNYIRETGFCSIVDFYNCARNAMNSVGQNFNIVANHTDANWGWSNLSGVKPEMTYNGSFRIGFPNTESRW